jgi:hypothetical protein
MAGYGYVTNNDDLRKALGGAGGGPPIIVNIDARGIDRKDLYWMQRHTENGIVKALRAGGYKG